MDNKEKTVICCDGQHASPFCPSCGKKLRERSVADEILCHFATTLKKHRSSLKTLRENLKKPGADKHKIEQRIAGTLKGIEKHERWRDALRELLEISDSIRSNQDQRMAS